ncbi:hypothetical protein DE146DRAFT_635658 [Phaeosphaeria sp. MPI-PUGE-AT-0046c]|nr:hypothetical protein DE146DRAFT_635658 [Phaeosphaeria sp. MPI-PUGE-AT-0046c]
MLLLHFFPALTPRSAPASCPVHSPSSSFPSRRMPEAVMIVSRANRRMGARTAIVMSDYNSLSRRGGTARRGLSRDTDFDRPTALAELHQAGEDRIPQTHTSPPPQLQASLLYTRCGNLGFE